MSALSHALERFIGPRTDLPFTERCRLAVNAADELRSVRAKLTQARHDHRHALEAVDQHTAWLQHVDRRVAAGDIPHGSYEDRDQRHQHETSRAEWSQRAKHEARNIKALEAREAELSQQAVMPRAEPKEHARLAELYRACFAEREQLRAELAEQQDLLRSPGNADLEALREHRAALVADVAIGAADQKQLDDLDQTLERLEGEDELHRQRVKRAKDAEPRLRQRLADADTKLATIARERAAHRERLILDLAAKEAETYAKAAAKLADHWARLRGFQIALEQEGRLPALKRHQPFIANGGFTIALPHGMTPIVTDYTAAAAKVRAEIDQKLTDIEAPE